MRGKRFSTPAIAIHTEIHIKYMMCYLCTRALRSFLRFSSYFVLALKLSFCPAIRCSPILSSGLWANSSELCSFMLPLFYINNQV